MAVCTIALQSLLKDSLIFPFCRTLDEGLAEAISSILWVAPRIQADVQEMSVITDQFAAKYGRPYVDVSDMYCVSAMISLVVF